MTRVRFIKYNGAGNLIEVHSGTSVVLAVFSNIIAGIEGECSGGPDCATCHMSIDEERFKHFPAATNHELELQGTVTPLRKPNSRLKAPFSVEPLTVFVPEAWT